MKKKRDLNRCVESSMRAGDYGKLTLIRPLGPFGSRYGQTTAYTVWECVCACGTVTTRAASLLVYGDVKSCGCAATAAVIKRNTTHGMSKCPEHRAWKGMRTRVRNPNRADYKHYGGRGITIDPVWDDFTQFLSDMGRKPSPSHSLERIDNDGPYAPWNCYWATKEEQGNNRRTNVFVTYKGETLTITQWAKKSGVPVVTLWGRLDRGWDMESALRPVLRLSSFKK